MDTTALIAYLEMLADDIESNAELLTKASIISHLREDARQWREEGER